jgi:hypothetical protein
MLIAKINNTVLMDHREVFPNTSFPPFGPSDEFLSEQGYAKVNAFKDHDSATQKLVPAEPYYEAPWVYTVHVVDKDNADIDAETESKAVQVRVDRDRLLSNSDWRVVKAMETGIVLSTEWVTYRQALRDVTQQLGFPWTIEWPTQP